MGRVLFTIPRLSTEWILSFDFITTKATWEDCQWLNILHLTKGGDNSEHGDRIPAIFINCATRKLLVYNMISGNPIVMVDNTEIDPNVLYHIEIHQRYISGGKYRFFVRTNGVETISVTNTDARQFYNVKVYANNPWYSSIDGIVQLFVNFRLYIDKAKIEEYYSKI